MANPYVIPNGTTMIVFCVQCDSMFELPVSEEQMMRWKSGELIRNVMPGLPRPERELFISGTCGRCWSRLFGPLKP
jgi:hypothetical protein